MKFRATSDHCGFEIEFEVAPPYNESGQCVKFAMLQAMAQEHFDNAGEDEIECWQGMAFGEPIAHGPNAWDIPITYSDGSFDEEDGPFAYEIRKA